MLRLILTVIIPPFGVFTKVGFGMAFWINLLLTALGYFPGVFHALWIINKDNRQLATS